MDRSFTKTLDSYLTTSRAWLMDCMRALDLASAGGALVAEESIKSSPVMPKVEDGPLFTHYDPAGIISYNVPVQLYTSTQFIRAMYLINEGDLTDSLPMPIPGLGDAKLRVESIICRSGIIAQFELWKKFAIERHYPVNKDDAGKHLKLGRMSCQDEYDTLVEVILRRNEMTHEPDYLNDPNAAELVDYTNKIHHVAKWVDGLHRNGHTQSWNKNRGRG